MSDDVFEADEFDDDPFAGETPTDQRPGSDAGGGEPEPQLVFANADEWVRGWLLLIWIPAITPGATAAHTDLDTALPDGVYWCSRWWRHPEALARVEALWRSWEKMRVDPWMGLALWFRDQFDHHWPRLVGPAGPLCRCTPSTHKDLPYLQAVPVNSHLADQDEGGWR